MRLHDRHTHTQSHWPLIKEGCPIKHGGDVFNSIYSSKYRTCVPLPASSQYSPSNVRIYVSRYLDNMNNGVP